MATDKMQRLRDLLGAEAYEEATTQQPTFEQFRDTSLPGPEHSDHHDHLHEQSPNMYSPFMGTVHVCYVDPASAEYQPHTRVAGVGGELSAVGDDRVVGELGAAGLYCPLLAVAKLPYKFIKHPSHVTQKISRDFFADNKFWNRTWTLYYVHMPPPNKYILMVPKSEVTELVRHIDASCPRTISFPQQRGFSVDFNAPDTPFPRFLGVSTSRTAMQTLDTRVPAKCIDFIVDRDGTVIPKCDAKTFEKMVEDLEAALTLTRNKDKIAGANKQEARVQTKAEWCNQLRRAQRYFGLNPVTPPSVPFDPFASPQMLDVNHAAPYASESDVIFVAVDVEAYERNHGQITEIGLAVLDSRALRVIPPGPIAVNWQSIVKARHFWIKEYQHLVNSNFVDGCPSSFEARFGTTESVSLREAIQHLQHCFEDPTSAFRHEIGPDQLSVVGQRQRRNENCPRKIVLVGHNIKADIELLRNGLNFDLTKAPNAIDMLDTSNLYRAMTHTEQSRSVSTLLHEFNITGWNLHNAGNDAAYTMQILTGIVVKSVSENCRIGNEEQIAQAKAEAEKRAKYSIQEWEKASGDFDDD